MQNQKIYKSRYSTNTHASGGCISSSGEKDFFRAANLYVAKYVGIKRVYVFLKCSIELFAQ